jgi:hypothetical protein
LLERLSFVHFLFNKKELSKCQEILGRP